MTNDAQAELFIPVRDSFDADSAAHERNMRAIEDWSESPFVSEAKIQNLAVTTAKIDDLAVTNAKIDDLSVTSAKITSLSADKITAGTLTAAVTVTGLLSAPATTGWRVEVGDAALPIRYWDGTDTKFSLDSAGNVVAVDIEVNQSASATTPALSVNGSDTAAAAMTIADSNGDVYFRARNDGLIQLYSAGGSGGNATLIATDDNHAIRTEARLVGADGVQTLVDTSGTAMTDAKFVNSPFNGTLAVWDDGAGDRRLYVRLAGNWRYAALT